MEEISAIIEPASPQHSTNHTGPRSSKRSFHSVEYLCLGLLSVFLLVGLITLSVLYHDSAADLSTVKESLAERLQACNNELSSMKGERDQLKASLDEMTKERDRLESLSKQKSGSWDEGREDCKGRGADLVVINSPEEQTFLSRFKGENPWIGLNDKENEGTWTWVDGTPLTISYWENIQPDNGGGSPQWGEEDCAQIRTAESTHWNDISCTTSLQWICEKLP
ncbi:CD209 antigen-like protein E [Stegastes partitus]|uniref:CD209 antigen-like protein E n=1 Tax=Stegastes partitus TaxID=144197 RepID=A0A3B4YVE8_9TELE|nr:PREDICTED: CD209 antigen-like protein E [Stegastes partitus]